MQIQLYKIHTTNSLVHVECILFIHTYIFFFVKLHENKVEFWDMCIG